MNSKKLIVGLPGYNLTDSMCMCALTKSLLELQRAHTFLSIDICQTEKELIHTARKIITERAYKGGYDYLLWVDNDQILRSDTLINLFARDLSFINALIYGRRYPYPPIGWTKESDNVYKRIPYTNNRGIIKVYVTGLGCALVKKEIIECTYDKDFQGETRFMGEDIAYCKIINEAGFDIFVDTDNVVGHCVNARIIVNEKSIGKLVRGKEQ